MMKSHSSYTPEIEEIHHIKKLDAPSGTAISLARGISDNNSGYDGWTGPEDIQDRKVTIHSVREGTVPGTHTVSWESEIDSVSIRHIAKGRQGFAEGAVIAAEFIQNRKGVFTMNDVLGF
jgi:4-hydroxy-tetrahydrodipicolinate reductase